ncbi:MAG: recombinase family protein [Patescibacteria group bacterium]|nr:recombinase family protein [Patescibacteria group bacterium]
MKYGYARVSTEDQSLDIQIAELTKAGCQDIRSEHRSGATVDGRAEFTKLLSELKKGDELWVVRIDRFARSLADLARLVDSFREKGIVLKATQQPIDTTTASGNAFLSMLGVFAQFEREITAERRIAGIAAAKINGKYAKCGRPSLQKRIDVAKAKAALETQRAEDVAESFGVSLSTLYRAVA